MAKQEEGNVCLRSKRFEINRTQLIGRGSYGSVYMGTLDDNITVAVKRIETHKATDRETEALSRLNHPNVLKLLCYDEDEDFRYYVFELCDASLDQLFVKHTNNDQRKYSGPIPTQEQAVFQLADGLAFIHNNNLAHRDIKPENVLIVTSSNGPTLLKWADFGLCKSVNCNGSYTMSGVKGTKKWMAPELLKLDDEDSELMMNGHRGTIQSDVFSAGCLFFYFLTRGVHPFGSRSSSDIINNIKILNATNIGELPVEHFAFAIIFKMILVKTPSERDNWKQLLKDFENQTPVERRNRKEMELLHLSEIRDLDKVSVVTRLKELIEDAEVSVNCIDSHRNTPLMLLCRNTSIGNSLFQEELVLELLLEQNEIEIGATDFHGGNALHLVCQFNDSDQVVNIAYLLIKKGINLDAMESEGQNALHLICTYHRNETSISRITQMLVEKGIDIQATNNYEENALHLLCTNHPTDELEVVVRFLLEKEICVNVISKDGCNSLHLLCQYNTKNRKLLHVVSLLLRYGIDFSALNFLGRNALHNLCRFGKSAWVKDVVHLLICRGIELNVADVDGNNALHLLCRFNDRPEALNLAFLLIEGQVDVNVGNNEGLNAMNLLCRFNKGSGESKRAIGKLLIESGLDISGRVMFDLNYSNIFINHSFI